MKITKHYQAYRNKPHVARWKENNKPKHRFFTTEEECDAFIERFQQESERQDTTIPLIEPRKLMRWQEASMLAPTADPLEVYRFWIRRQEPALQEVLLAEASRDYLKMMMDVGRDRAYASHARKALEDFRGEVGNRPIHSLDTEMLRGHLYGLPYAAVTIRHRRSHLLCAFTWWVEQGWLTDNPVDKVKRPQVVNGEPGILTVEEVRRLFRLSEKVDPEICGLLALGTFAGMRASAIAKVDFPEIDFGQRGILTPASKTKKRRRQWIEDLPDNLWSWLERTPKAAFQMTQRQMLHRRSEAYKRAGLLIEADDIAYENRKRRNKGQQSVDLKVKCPPKNCLRHSFASYHVALHRNPGKTALILSHRNQEVLYQHYLGIATQKQAKGYFQILPMA